MKRQISIIALLISCELLFAQQGELQQTVLRFPADKAQGVNPDTHLVLTFPSRPALHCSGEIRIYDAADDRLVDTLDMSIPPGPHNTRTLPPYDTFSYEKWPQYSTLVRYRPRSRPGDANTPPITYQINYIGGSTEQDAYHFYPVIMHGNGATICPHAKRLDYGKTYYVQIDPGVLTLEDGSFSGIAGKTGWTFSTKKSPPAADSKRLVVSADGTGDFNTVQGALDSIADNSLDPVTIYIKNGVYDEIVYFRNKLNITFLGEDRDKVVIGYANNGIFNPRRRGIFTVAGADSINIVNLTLKSIGEAPAQNEGLSVRGRQIIVNDVTIDASGDVVQAHGTIYFADCRITGYGDNILGTGAVFFNNCDLISTFGPHVWVRNSAKNHGDVFLNCTFRMLGTGETTIARTNDNGVGGYPDCEAVLINCALSGIKPVGWGLGGGRTTNIHYWEYNSTNLSDGKPLDVSKRDPISRQLDKEKDAELVANYSNPTYVLGGWTPLMAPLVLSQPESVVTGAGQPAVFAVRVAAVPTAAYRWFKNGRMIPGATSPVLVIDNAWAGDAGSYCVTASNEAGSVTSREVTLKLVGLK